MIRSKISIGIGFLIEDEIQCNNFLKCGDSLPSEETSFPFYTIRENQTGMVLPIYISSVPEKVTIFDRDMPPSFRIEILLPPDLAQYQLVDVKLSVDDKLNIHVNAECNSNLFTTVYQVDDWCKQNNE